ncbi:MULTISPECIES: hypothetical protein [Actinomycetes]|uniref:8-oxoguanine DNA glycosylase OGG fold protein n=1 Tax=Actinomycetes TaxID=1760 RepID=UPI00068AAACC|nr:MULTISPECIES: hypothetical protein [Actinomycetes]
MTSIPAALRHFSTTDVASHRVQFNPEAWRTTFADHGEALTQLAHHAHTEGGIARAYIHHRADTDPIELFLISMVWGYGKVGYGPRRISDILNQVGAVDKLRAIVETTSNDGAAAGWNALLNTHRIGGLDMSFGTKLLYFAGYTTDHRPRPLILDNVVRTALQDAAPGTVPASGRVHRDDYIRYLQLAEDWAADPEWNVEPDVIEYALFNQR